VTPRDRAEGALLGLAVGDALGTTLEFTRPGQPPRGVRFDGPHRDVTGGGPFHVVAGQVTDDTHMACCLAGALGHDGLDVDGLARAYVDWAKVTFDIGNLTRGAVDGLARGDRDVARQLWEASGHDAAPNGSLMRTAPIGVRFAADPARRRAAAFDDSSLTHFDPRCQLACAAFDAAIAAGIAGARDPRDLVRAATDELRAASVALIDRLPEDATGWVLEARGALGRDLTAALGDDPDLHDRGADRLDLHDHAGFVRVAFRLAFWELVHADGYLDGVIDVVNRGGDADTNGAIAGALLGAYHGIGAIPPSWIRRVLDAVPDRGAPSLRDEYHPRVLLAALDRWGW
jgi:ADP-ribosylglycohydrolase